MSSDKIFVDLDEEITFTVEKIISSSAGRIIVVIPESANLVASLISLKLLSSQVNKSDKLIVAVTEDKLGLRLSKKAGIITKEKISDITPKVWVQAEDLKKEFLEERKKLKDKLIGERSESVEYEIVDEEKMEDESQEESSEVGEKSEEKEAEALPEFAPPLVQKPRLDPKVVNLGTISVLAGGDIEANSKFLDEIEKKEQEKEKEKEAQKKTPEEVRESTSEESAKEEVSEEPDKAKVDLIGRDWSSYLPEQTKEPKRREMPSADAIKKIGISQKLGSIRGRILGFYKSGNTKLKIGVTIAVVLALFFILTTVVFSSANVMIRVTKANVLVNEPATGSASLPAVDYANRQVPISQIKVDESSSNSADTTGNVDSGNKAKGLVTLYNKTEEEVTLTVGTEIENIATNSKYKITTASTVPAAVVDGGGNVNVGVRQDVPIEAVSHGESYNTTGSASYKIAGYTTDQLSGKSFNDIEGGDTSEERAVDQGDIDTLKSGLVAELKNTLILELEQLVSDDEVLLQESIKYGAGSSTTDKNAGDQADTVSVTVNLDATAFVISKADLRAFVAEAIKGSSEFEGEVDEEKLDDPVIEGISVDGETVAFTIKSDGDIVGGVTEEDVAKNISGKSIGEAESYLSGLEGVESYKLSVSPFFVPSFLKKLPDEGKIDVDIRTAKAK